MDGRGRAMEQIRNINSIQIFSAVSHTRNVTRAAKLLNTSQSAVSYHIKKLETDLSVSLFRRTASGLELTEEGALLAAHVERGLGAIRCSPAAGCRRVWAACWR